MNVQRTRPDPLRGAALQAFWLLRIGFTAAPILFGIDKFFTVRADPGQPVASGYVLASSWKAGV